MSDEFTTLGTDLETGERVSLARDSRRLGTYVIGLTGTGKTTLLLNIILQDIAEGDGVCVLDPHGDLTEDILKRIPEDREEDVILFEPFDTERSFGLNLFECSDIADPNLVDLVCSQALGTFYKLFHESWGPQMEDLLRVTSLTLIYNQDLDERKRPTLAEIPDLLTDEDYRSFLVSRVSEGTVRGFWEKTYNPLRPYEKLEYHRSSLNKVRRFLLNTTIRNIVGQPTSSLDIRRVMDEGKILLANLSKGRLGEDNSALLGSILVGKILIAALSRADRPPEERRPFHLIVDEYQSFATTSFPTLQSEARKFAIDTVVAHQYRDQLDIDNKGSTLNVGNKIIFRVNGPDSAELAKEFDNTPPEPIIVGEHIIRTEPGNPWFELKKGNHRNERVKEIVRYLVRYLHYLQDDMGGLTIEAWKPDGHGTEVDKIRYFEERLDEYIYRRLLGESKEQSQGLWDWLWKHGPFDFNIVAVLGPDQWFDIAAELERNEKHQAELRSALEEFQETNKNKLEVSYPESEEYQRYKAMESEMREEVLSAVGQKKTIRQQDRYQMQRVYYGRLDELISILQKEPVMVASGQVVPIYERARAYSDVEAETANKLSSLPQFTARCKLVLDGLLKEYAFKSLHPSSFSSDGYGRAQAIREQSRRLYGRERSAVEAAVRSRTEIIRKESHGDREEYPFYEEVEDPQPPQDS